MTQENTEKPEKSPELPAIRYAAMLWYFTRGTDAKLANEVGATVDVIARWKRSREWEEVLQKIANKQIVRTPSPILALTAHELQALKTTLPNATLETREMAARALLNLGRSPGKTSSKDGRSGLTSQQ